MPPWCSQFTTIRSCVQVTDKAVVLCVEQVSSVWHRRTAGPRLLCFIDIPHSIINRTFKYNIPRKHEYSFNPWGWGPHPPNAQFYMFCLTYLVGYIRRGVQLHCALNAGTIRREEENLKWYLANVTDIWSESSPYLWQLLATGGILSVISLKGNFVLLIVKC